MKKVKWYIIGIGGFLLLLVMVLLNITNKPVITVNGEDIYEEEYAFLENVSTGLMEGKSGKDRVRIAKCEQILLKRNHILSDISYDTFMNELEQINQERKEVLDQGGIVYGPDTFSAKIYYDYKYSEARERLLREIWMKEITEEDIKEYGNEEGNCEISEQEKYAIAMEKYKNTLFDMAYAE